MARPWEIQRSAERGSERVMRREDAFLFGSRTALGLIHRISVMHDGSRKQGRFLE
jgi:hypothetical protein